MVSWDDRWDGKLWEMIKNDQPSHFFISHLSPLISSLFLNEWDGGDMVDGDDGWLWDDNDIVDGWLWWWLREDWREEIEFSSWEIRWDIWWEDREDEDGVLMGLIGEGHGLFPSPLTIIFSLLLFLFFFSSLLLKLTCCLLDDFKLSINPMFNRFNLNKYLDLVMSALY